MNSVLVLGGTGQLGIELSHYLSYYGINVYAVSREHLECNNNTPVVRKAVENILGEHKIDAVINCIAYTSVDKAEDNLEEAMYINSVLPMVLAQTCERAKVLLIHFSTDYVFGGEQYLPLKETDPTEPSNVYGLSKLHGELAVQEHCSRFLIFRLSWLYSYHRRNFAKTVLELAQIHSTLNIVGDQIGSPTSAKAVAEYILHVLRNYPKATGLFHLSAQGETSWFEFAKKITDKAKAKYPELMWGDVKMISSHEFQSKVKRPSYSVLNNTKSQETFGKAMSHWEAQLDDFFSQV